MTLCILITSWKGYDTTYHCKQLMMPDYSDIRSNHMIVWGDGKAQMKSLYQNEKVHEVARNKISNDYDKMIDSSGCGEVYNVEERPWIQP